MSNNFELRWLIKGVDRVLQYRVKYENTVWPIPGGPIAENPHTEMVWSEWTNVKEVSEIKENTK